MKIVRTLSASLNLAKPCGLTIGNFDGMHLGHQAVLKRLKEICENENKFSCVLTFDNNPSEVLRPDHPKLQLCSLSHKMHLLEQAGIDILVLLTFTKEFSEQSADVFLQKLHTLLSFSDLVLGYDAALGHNREGDRARVGLLAQSLGFNLEYIEQLYFQNIALSSSAVRNLILNGEIVQAEKLLGRKYSLCGYAIQCEVQTNATILTLDLSGLCLPPAGRYAVNLLYNKKIFRAEIHLLAALKHTKVVIAGKHPEIENKYIELIFLV